jgi:cytochrome c
MAIQMGRGILVALITLQAGIALAAGDVQRGARVFQQCASCHSIEPGKHLTGPSLAKVWGRKAGSDATFPRYSDALERSGVAWSEETLQRWLANPQEFVPGNAMTFAGLRDAQARSDVIAYLHAVSEGKAPAAASPMAGGMMGAAEPADLRGAPADSRVAAIRHCRDTYIVRTHDGKTHKVWEFNVRLKTDSSERGPRPGVPVVAGSGMRGDRVSIVFASPAEISRMIQETCQ